MITELIPQIIYDSVATVQSNVNFLAAVTKQAIVTPVEMQGVHGNVMVNSSNIAGFVFDVIDEDGIQLQSNITDHYLEDNTPVQDHIALRPVTVTVKGYVGELIYTNQQIRQMDKPLQAISRKFDVAEALLPELTDQANQFLRRIKNIMDTANKLVETTENLNKLFNNKMVNTKGTKQQKAWSYFYALWESRAVFTVDTPWQTFTNMVIETMEVTQGVESADVSDFSIKFKQLRFAKKLNILRVTGIRKNQLSASTNGKITDSRKFQSGLSIQFQNVDKKYQPSFGGEVVLTFDDFISNTRNGFGGGLL